ncbi:MAG: hypothetical protein OXH65_03225 [Paracoccaceae bacterium]|nr:hypothetical protein [Paracoccaceae bacterium]MDE2674101.1 hypothetical protein [Paracoccaceae bacterium]
MIKILATVLLVLFSTSVIGEEDSISNRDRFELWANCQPVYPLFDYRQVNTTFILPENIEIAVENMKIAVQNRLRSARLYQEQDTHPLKLYVSIQISGPAFMIGMQFHKPVQDVKFGTYFLTPTWEVRSFGTHDYDFNGIAQRVSGYTDRFINEYLRVNADSC